MGGWWRVCFCITSVTLAAVGCGDESDPATVPLDELTPGSTATMWFWAHCGAEHLGREIAGKFWIAEGRGAGVDWIPDGWRSHVNDDERLELELALVNTDRLEVSVAGTDAWIVYVPTNHTPGCD